MANTDGYKRALRNAYGGTGTDIGNLNLATEVSSLLEDAPELGMEALGKIVNGGLSRSKLQSAQQTASLIRIENFITQFKKKSDDEQRVEFENLPDADKAVMEQLGYQVPEKNKSGGWLAPVGQALGFIAKGVNKVYSESGPLQYGVGMTLKGFNRLWSETTRYWRAQSDLAATPDRIESLYQDARRELENEGVELSEDEWNDVFYQFAEETGFKSPWQWAGDKGGATAYAKSGFGLVGDYTFGIKPAVNVFKTIGDNTWNKLFGGGTDVVEFWADNPYKREGGNGAVNQDILAKFKEKAVALYGNNPKTYRIGFAESWNRAYNGEQWVDPAVRNREFAKLKEANLDSVAYDIAAFMAEGKEIEDWLQERENLDPADPQFAKRRLQLTGIIQNETFKDVMSELTAGYNKVSPGRIAAQYAGLSKNTLAFDVYSGATDLAANLVLDPTIIAGKFFVAGRGAAKAVNVVDASKIGTAIKIIKRAEDTGTAIDNAALIDEVEQVASQVLKDTPITRNEVVIDDILDTQETLKNSALDDKIIDAPEWELLLGSNSTKLQRKQLIERALTIFERTPSNKNLVLNVSEGMSTIESLDETRRVLDVVFEISQRLPWSLPNNFKLRALLDDITPYLDLIPDTQFNWKRSTLRDRAIVSRAQGTKRFIDRINESFIALEAERSSGAPLDFIMNRLINDLPGGTRIVPFLMKRHNELRAAGGAGFENYDNLVDFVTGQVDLWAGGMSTLPYLRKNRTNSIAARLRIFGSGMADNDVTQLFMLPELTRTGQPIRRFANKFEGISDRVRQLRYGNLATQVLSKPVRIVNDVIWDLTHHTPTGQIVPLGDEADLADVLKFVNFGRAADWKPEEINKWKELFARGELPEEARFAKFNGKEEALKQLKKRFANVASLVENLGEELAEDALLKSDIDRFNELWEFYNADVMGGLDEAMSFGGSKAIGNMQEVGAFDELVELLDGIISKTQNFYDNAIEAEPEIAGRFTKAQEYVDVQNKYITKDILENYNSKEILDSFEISDATTVASVDTLASRYFLIDKFLGELFNSMGIKLEVGNDVGRSPLNRFYERLKSRVYAPNNLDTVQTATGPQRMPVFPVTQYSTQSVIPKFLDLYRHWNNLNFLQKSYRVLFSNEMLDTVIGRYWKIPTLLRIGFVPRAAGEEFLAFFGREGFRSLEAWVAANITEDRRGIFLSAGKLAALPTRFKKFSQLGAAGIAEDYWKFSQILAYKNVADARLAAAEDVYRILSSDANPENLKPLTIFDHILINASWSTAQVSKQFRKLSWNMINPTLRQGLLRNADLKANEQDILSGLGILDKEDIVRTLAPSAQAMWMNPYFEYERASAIAEIGGAGIVASTGDQIANSTLQVRRFHDDAESVLSVQVVDGYELQDIVPQQVSFIETVDRKGNVVTTRKVKGNLAANKLDLDVHHQVSFGLAMAAYDPIAVQGILDTLAGVVSEEDALGVLAMVLNPYRIAETRIPTGRRKLFVNGKDRYVTELEYEDYLNPLRQYLENPNDVKAPTLTPDFIDKMVADYRSVQQFDEPVFVSATQKQAEEDFIESWFANRRLPEQGTTPMPSASDSDFAYLVSNFLQTYGTQINFTNTNINQLVNRLYSTYLGKISDTPTTTFSASNALSTVRRMLNGSDEIPGYLQQYTKSFIDTQLSAVTTKMLSGELTDLSTDMQNIFAQMLVGLRNGWFDYKGIENATQTLIDSLRETNFVDVLENYFVRDFVTNIRSWVSESTGLNAKSDSQSFAEAINKILANSQLTKSLLDQGIWTEETLNSIINPQVAASMLRQVPPDIWFAFQNYDFRIVPNNNPIVARTPDNGVLSPIGDIQVFDPRTGTEVDSEPFRMALNNIKTYIDMAYNSYWTRALGDIESGTRTFTSFANDVLRAEQGPFVVDEAAASVKFDEDVYADLSLQFQRLSELSRQFSQFTTSGVSEVSPSVINTTLTDATINDTAAKAFEVRNAIQEAMESAGQDVAAFEYLIVPTASVLVDKPHVLTLTDFDKADSVYTTRQTRIFAETLDELQQYLSQLDPNNFTVVAVRPNTIPSFFAPFNNPISGDSVVVKQAIFDEPLRKVVSSESIESPTDQSWLAFNFAVPKQMPFELTRTNIVEDLERIAAGVDPSATEFVGPIYKRQRTLRAENPVRGVDPTLASGKELNIESLNRLIAGLQERGALGVDEWKNLDEELPFGTTADADSVLARIQQWKDTIWKPIPKYIKKDLQIMIQYGAAGDLSRTTKYTDIKATPEELSIFEPALQDLYNRVNPNTNPLRRIVDDIIKAQRKGYTVKHHKPLISALNTYANLNNPRLAHVLFDERPIRIGTPELVRQEAVDKTYALLNDPDFAPWVDTQRSTITGFLSGVDVKRPLRRDERRIFSIHLAPDVIKQIRNIYDTDQRLFRQMVNSMGENMDARQRSILENFFDQFDSEIAVDPMMRAKRPISYVVFNNQNDAEAVANALRSIRVEGDVPISSIDTNIQVVDKIIPRSNAAIDYNVLQDLDSATAQITRNDGFNDFEVVFESLLDPKMELAERMYDTVISMFQGSNGNILQEWIMPSVRGTFDMSAVASVSVADMPTKMFAPRPYVYDPGWFQKVGEYGFSKFNSAIFSIVRKPMYLLGFANSYEAAKTIGKKMRDDGLYSWMEKKLISYRRTYQTKKSKIGRYVEALPNQPMGPGLDEISYRAFDGVDLNTIRRVWYMIPGDVQDAIMTQDDLYDGLENLVYRQYIERSHPIFDFLEELKTPEDYKNLLDFLRHDAYVEDALVRIAHNGAMQSVIPYIDDSSVRSFYQDKVKNIFPFLFAQEAFLKRWIRSAIYDPNTIRRTQLIGQSLTQSVFTEKDEYGNSYFVIPMSERINELLSMPGLDVLFGNLQVPGKAGLGVNVATVLPGVPKDFSNLPAFSPYAMVGVNELAKRNPEFIPFFEQFTGDYPIVPEKQGSPLDIKFYYENFVPRSYQRIIYGVFEVGPEVLKNELAASTMAAMRQAIYQAELLELEQQRLIGEGKADEARALQPSIDELKMPDNATTLQIEGWVDRVKNWAKANMVLRSVIGWTTGSTPTNIWEGEELEQDFKKLLRYMPLDEAVAVFLAENPGANPYTVFLSGKASKAELPRSEQAMDWLDDNRNWIESYPKSAVWLIPQSENNDEYSARADAAYRAYKMRWTKQPMDWYKDYKFAAGATEYFPLKVQYEAAIENTNNRSERARLREEWNLIAEDIRVRNPLFAEQLLTRGQFGESEQVLTELSEILALDDSDLPQIDHINELRSMVDGWREYSDQINAIKGQTSSKARNFRKQLKRNFLIWGENEIQQNPNMRLFWMSVVLPATSLTTDYDVMKELG